MRLGLIRARVSNSATGDGLWDELQQECERIKTRYELLEVNARPAVAGTRRLYKHLGKDPGRYRVSSEALCRRIIRGLGIYRLTTLVDIINLVSIRSGYAISGLDAGALAGDSLRLDVGTAADCYHGIGRGVLNIEGMPVWRDGMGGVATPTSDEERTKIGEGTTMVQININAFAPEMPMEECVSWTVALLGKYAAATDVETRIIDDFDDITF